jgi:hypothetical protein
VKRAVALALAALVAIWARKARAEDLSVQQEARPADQLMRDGLRHDAFLPLSMGTDVTAHRSAALAWGGYASDRARAVVDARAEAALTSWLVLQVRTATDTESTGLHPSVGVRARLLGESDGRPGIALGAFYKAEGFTEPEGEMEGVLAISTHAGNVRLVGNLVYGQDAGGRDRDGEAGAAASMTLRDRWLLAFDGHARLNLAARAAPLGQPAAPRFDLLAGPLVMCRLGPTFLGGQTGLAMIELADLRVGAFALLGFGAVL